MEGIRLNSRENTKSVKVSNLLLGGNSDVLIQSMTNTDTRDVQSTIEQIEQLAKAGCHIARLAVPDEDAAKAFSQIREKSRLPLVADIHFDYRLALTCMDGGADKVRINPGNIGSEDGVKAVALMARKKRIPIRIGVNSGSLSKRILEEYGNTPRGMVESAFEHIEMLNRYDFDDIVISLKASNVIKTIEAYRLMSMHSIYPLHLGVTEAGTLTTGTVKSAIGIGTLLLDGIGDTIRVSLTADPVEEVIVAQEILKSIGLSSGGIELISCPSCGRCKIDLIKIANQVQKATANIPKKLKVAVMGCAVNGPGEAREADIGVAGGDGCGLLFKKGEILKKVNENEIVDALIAEIKEM